jgi:hypothetical protein
MAPRPRPKPKPPKPPKPVKMFWLRAYMFEFQEAGPIREPMLGLYIGDGTNSRYYGWALNPKDPARHASDWAVMHNQKVKTTIFSGLRNVRLIHYEVADPVTIDELVPENNRTQIAIVRQMNDGFLVRFIISYNNDKNRHHMMVEYPGVAPRELFGKPLWGRMYKAGSARVSMSPLFAGDWRM